MQNTKGLPMEVRLSAYIDGEVNDAERRELEDMIARDDEARLLLDMLRAGNMFGNKAFEDFLHDPVPLALVRRIRQGTEAPLKAERILAVAPRRKTARLWPRALAASVALLLIGGSTGFIIGMTRADKAPPADMAHARTWLDDIADYHRIYAREENRLAEVPAAQSETIKTWLAQSVGVTFALPELSAQGLTFEGARLLVAAGRPVAQLLYTNENGDVFAICFLKSTATGPQGQLSESIRDDLGLISWQKSGASYVVVGPSSAAGLTKIAEVVSAEI